MGPNNSHSERFLDLVRRDDLSGVISDAELAAMAVQFLRSVDVSKGTSDADFAAMAVRFLRSVCERFIERDGGSVDERLKGRWKSVFDQRQELMHERRFGQRG